MRMTLPSQLNGFGFTYLSLPLHLLPRSTLPWKKKKIINRMINWLAEHFKGDFCSALLIFSFIHLSHQVTSFFSFFQSFLLQIPKKVRRSIFVKYSLAFMIVRLKRHVYNVTCSAFHSGTWTVLASTPPLHLALASNSSINFSLSRERRSAEEAFTLQLFVPPNMSVTVHIIRI